MSTYSILVGFHVAVRGLYTAHWRNEIEYSEIASQELAAVRRWTANARWVAIFLPVLACSLYLNMGEDFISDVSFTVMRVSLWFFVALGGFSAWLSISCGGSILKYVEEISSDVDSRFN